MSVRMRALQKREKLALLAVLLTAAGIVISEVWFPVAAEQTPAPAAVPANVKAAAGASPAPAETTGAPQEIAPPETTAATPSAEAAPTAATAAAATTSASTPEAAAPAEAVASAALPVANLFPVQTWQPPPPPPPPPPKPKAPPLPFQYSGQLVEGGEIVIFLAQQKRQHVVRAGDAIDNLYRVEAITPGRIEFTYLPLQQKQELLTGKLP